MREILDKQVKENSKKNFWGSCKPTKKCAMKNEERNKKKQCVHKNVFNGRKWFINSVRGTGETDCNKIRVNDF